MRSRFETIALHQRTVSARLIEGELVLEKLVFADAPALEWKVTVRPQKAASVTI